MDHTFACGTYDFDGIFAANQYSSLSCDLEILQIERNHYGFYQEAVSVETESAGEPTRIVIDRYLSLTGTLVERREQAMTDHDSIRERLIFWLRSHRDIYGGTFHCIVAPDALSFDDKFGVVNPAAADEAVSSLQARIDRHESTGTNRQARIDSDSAFQLILTHPGRPELNFLYSIMLAEKGCKQARESSLVCPR